MRNLLLLGALGLLYFTRHAIAPGLFAQTPQTAVDSVKAHIKQLGVQTGPSDTFQVTPEADGSHMVVASVGQYQVAARVHADGTVERLGDW